MRIAIDGSHWAIPGGIRSYLENLLPAIRRVAPQSDLQVLLRGRTSDAADTLPEGVTPVSMRWPRRILDRLENSIGFPRVERFCGKVDAVHGVHFSLPAARRGVPSVLTVHDVAYLRRPDLYDDPRGNDYGYRTLLPNALRRADRVIAISHAAKEDLVEVSSIDPDKVWVVGHGVDPRFTKPSSEEISAVRRAVGIEGEFILFPVGTITPRKNVERTLTAFSVAFPDPMERPALLLTGPGDLPGTVDQLVGALGLEISVRCASVRYPDDLRALYGAALFGLYPSLYEGFGLPPLEAMACGLPMLVADATSCPEVVGNAAELVDPESTDAIADGMRRLFDRPQLRDRLRALGHARVEHPAFSWDRAARQTLAVYRGDIAAYREETDPLTPDFDRAVEPEVTA